MELSLNNSLLAGDPRLIDHIVGEVKSQGIFDQFRKECIADVDTKPAYQNLRTRVESSVNLFLNKQSWKPELNKNQFRETLRKHIHEAPYLDAGVERIVDQVVNPKAYSVFMPQIEDVVYKFLGIERPKPRERNGPCSLKDLLPKDLDPVSPESDRNSLKNESWETMDESFEPANDESRETPPLKIEESQDGKSENEKKPEDSSKGAEVKAEENNLNDSVKSEEKAEEEEEDSPSFEPIDIMNLNESNMSNDSYLSGISELTSHREQSRSPDYDYSRDNFDASNQDSQLSKVSSNSRLSIITDIGSSNAASSSLPDFKSDEKSDSKGKENKRNFDLELIKSRDNSQDSKDVKMYKNNVSSKENSTDATDGGRDKEVKERNREDSSKSKSSKDKSSSRDSRSYREKEKDKDGKKWHHSSSNSKIEKSKSKSSSNSKEKTEDAKESKDLLIKVKEKVEKNDKKDVMDMKDIYKERIRELREKKELTEKEKLLKTSKETKEKKESSRDKKEPKKEHKSSHNSSTTKREDKSSKSSKDTKSEKDKDRKDKSKKEEPKKSSNSKKDEKKSKTEIKSSDKNEKLDRNKEKSSKDKKRREDKKKLKDDHSSQRKNSSDRRSTDRDGSNGSGGKSFQNGSNGSSSSSRKSSSSNLNKESTSMSQSSSETSDGIEDAHSIPLKSSPAQLRESRINEQEFGKKSVDLDSQELSLPLKKRPLPEDSSSQEVVRLKKPKFAKNFAEAKRLMKVRKRMEREMQEQQEEEKKVEAAEKIIEEDVAIIPDEERVQIIEIPDEEDDQSYLEDDSPWTLEKTSEIILADELCFQRNSKTNVQSKLSQMDSTIRSSLHEMISDEKLLERNDGSQCTIRNLEEKAVGKNKAGVSGIVTDKKAEEKEKNKNESEEDKNNQNSIKKDNEEGKNKSMDIEDSFVQTPLKARESSSKDDSKVASSPEQDCLYLSANDGKTTRKLSMYIESLKSTEIMEILGGQSISVEKKTMAPPNTGSKRARESPMNDILMNANNNNEGSKSESPDLREPQLKRKRGRPKKKPDDANVCNTSICNGENFVMPLSPESDVSATSEKTSGGTEEKRRQKSKQHYTSDDLYKPRPLFASSSRRNRRSSQA